MHPVIGQATSYTVAVNVPVGSGLFWLVSPCHVMVALTVDTLPVESKTYQPNIDVLRRLAVGVGVADGVAVGVGVKVGEGVAVLSSQSCAGTLSAGPHT